MKNNLIKGFVSMAVLSLTFCSMLSAAEETVEKTGNLSLDVYRAQFEKSSITDEEYLDQIEQEKKKYGISGREIQAINLYYMKFMNMDTWEVTYVRLPLLREDGQVRERVVTRKQMTMPLGSGIESKAEFSFIAPNEVRGMKALMFSYYSPDKESDYWMYLPSLRRIRRISAADRDDSFFGSDCTWADAADIKVDEEKHRIIGVEKYPVKWDKNIYVEPYPEAWEHVYNKDCVATDVSRDDCEGLDHNFSFKGKFTLSAGKLPRLDNLGPEVYVVESIPQWPTYYAKKITRYHKKHKFALSQDYYDEKGRHIKYFKRTWIKIGEIPGQEGSYWSISWWFIKNLLTGHSTFHDIITQKANPPLREADFTQSHMLSTGR
jgi:hypothetical protein